ncbi:MAG: RHS repeat-associated core domain-containing protein [Deltaproteobacteria bacterium]
MFRTTLGLITVTLACGNPTDTVQEETQAITDDRSGPLEQPMGAESFGLMSGRLDVDRNGAANYVLDLDLPPGRARLSPSLALSYNSNRGQGHFGVGFSISGRSSIRRCAKSFAIDGEAHGVDYLSSDAYCLDGERLVEVERTRFEENIRIEFRTRKSSRARIVAFGEPNPTASAWEPTSFEVESHDGTIRSYGSTENSKIRSHRDWPFHRAWLLDQTRDRFGNAVDYTYSKVVAPQHVRVASEDAEVLLEKITYARHLPTGLAPAHEIDFVYEPDTYEPMMGYAVGSASRMTMLVDRIQIRTHNQDTYYYDLSYRGSTATRRALLHSVQKCANHGGCLEPITFDYQEPELTTPSALDVTPLLAIPSSKYGLADVNGDGRADHYRFYPKTVEGTQMLTIDVAYAGEAGPTGSPFGHWSASNIHLPYDPNATNGLVPLDMNNDGRSDFVHFVRNAQGGVHAEHPRFRVVRSTEDGLVPVELSVDVPAAIVGFYVSSWTITDNGDAIINYSPDPKKVTSPWMDANGDGLLDLWDCKPSNTLGDDRVGVALNLGGLDFESTFRVSETLGTPCVEGASARFDMNGDGAHDVFAHYSPGAASVRMEGGELVTYPLAQVPMGVTHLSCRRNDDPTACPVQGDFNGDGNRDVIIRHYDPHGPDGSANRIYFGTGEGLLGIRDGIEPGVADGFALPHADLGEWDGRGTDLNLDGKDDLIYSDDERTLKVRLSTGRSTPVSSDAWLQELTIVVPDDGQTEADFTVADIDGNGAVDIVVWTGERHLVYLFDSERPDLLTEVRETPQTTTVQLDYAPLADADVYDRSTCTAAYPTKCVPGAGYYVVKTVDHDAGPTHPTRRVRMHYENAKTSVSGLGWVGFEKVTETDELSGQITERTYDLGYDATLAAYPFADQPASVRESIIVDDPDASQGSELSTLTTSAFDVFTIDGTWLPYTRVQLVEEREGGQLTTRRQVEVERIDLYGFPDLIRTTVGDDETLEERRVFHFTNPWFRGRHDHVTTTYSTPTETHVRHTGFAWNESTATLDGIVERTISDPSYRSTAIDYDAYGNPTLVSTSDLDGNTRWVERRYEDSDHAFPTSTIDDLGTTATQFDPRNGRLLRVETPAGVVERFAYDAFGRIRQAEGADATSTTVERGPPLDLTYGYFRIDVEDPRTPRRTVEVDRLGREFRTVWTAFDGVDVEQRTIFDALGRERERWMPSVVGAVVPDDRRTITTYDAAGRVIVRKAPGLGYEVHDYDPGTASNVDTPAGLEHEVHNPRGFSTRTIMDEHGRVAQRIDALDGVTSYHYGAFSRLRSVVDAGGNTTVIQHDHYGLREAVDSPSSGYIGFDYNAFGEVKTIAPQHGATVSFQYDDLGRVVERTVGSEVTTFAYDTAPNGLGLLASAQSSDGHTSTMAYDEFQRIDKETFIVESELFEYVYDYDPAGRLSRLTYPKSLDGSRLAIRHEYRNGFLTAVVNDANDEPFWIRRAASPEGWTTDEDYGNGVRTESSYRPFGALATTKSSGGLMRSATDVIRDERYDYDNNGNLRGRTDRLDEWQEIFDYDPLDRLLGGCIEGGTAVPSLVPRADGRSEEPFHYVTPTFVTNGREGLVPEPTFAGGVSGPMTFEMATTDPVTGRLLSSVGTFTRSENEALLRGALSTTPSCSSADYDAVGNLRVRSGVGTYHYDSSAVEQGPVPGQPRVRYQPYALSRIDREDGSTTTVVHDAFGRLVDNGTEYFEWTADNLVRRIVDQATGLDASFEYDAFGRRARKTTPSEATAYAGSFQRRRTIAGGEGGTRFVSGGSVADIHFIAVEGRVVAELTKYVDGFSDLALGFLGDEQNLGLVPTELEQRITDFANGGLSSRATIVYYHRDHLGSVELVTGSRGEVVEERSYDAWGQRRADPARPLTPSTALWATQEPVGFTGHERDEEFGLVNMVGRIYDPRVGRMASSDPFVADPLNSQSYNRYSYVWNNPLSLADPTGFEPEPPEASLAPTSSKLDDRPIPGGSVVTMPPLEITDVAPPEAATGGEAAAPSSDEVPWVGPPDVFGPKAPETDPIGALFAERPIELSFTEVDDEIHVLDEGGEVRMKISGGWQARTPYEARTNRFRVLRDLQDVLNVPNLPGSIWKGARDYLKKYGRPIEIYLTKSRASRSTRRRSVIFLQVRDWAYVKDDSGEVVRETAERRVALIHELAHYVAHHPASLRRGCCQDVEHKHFPVIVGRWENRARAYWGLRPRVNLK